MNKLSKNQIEEFENLKTSLEEAKLKLENKIIDHNQAMKDSFKDVDNAKEEYNKIIEDIEEFRAQIADDQESYYDEKGDKWKEGDKGSAYQDWQNKWRNELTEIDVDEPGEVEGPDFPEFNEDEYPFEPEGV